MSTSPEIPVTKPSSTPWRVAAAGDDVATRLKRETAAEHAAIEAASGILHQNLTSAEYRGYLERWFGFLSPLEDELCRREVWAALGLEATQRSKRAALERDLIALGSSIAQLPLAALPALESVSEMVGAAYVIEGSTLGGRVLSRHVQSRLGPELPRAFLEVYGPHTGQCWQAFRQALSGYASARDTQDRVIAGAQLTFRAFTRWLEGPPPR